MNKATIFVELAALALLSTSALAVTTTSPQNNKEQVHSMWCWNASVRNLIYTESNGKRDLWQCDIGNFVFGVNYACRFNNTFSWKDRANGGNWLKKDVTRDIYSILNKYGFNRLRHYPAALSFFHMQQSINHNHGVLTAWLWKKGGGHIVVAYGYNALADGSKWVKISDPWPGEGEYWRTYEEYVGGKDADHTTAGTLRVID